VNSGNQGQLSSHNSHFFHKLPRARKRSVHKSERPLKADPLKRISLVQGKQIAVISSPETGEMSRWARKQSHDIRVSLLSRWKLIHSPTFDRRTLKQRLETCSNLWLRVLEAVSGPSQVLLFSRRIANPLPLSGKKPFAIPSTRTRIPSVSLSIPQASERDELVLYPLRTRISR